jgi:putative hydrolase of the HAD superfamily
MTATIFFDFGNVLAFFDHYLAAARLAALVNQEPEVLHSILFGGDLEDGFETGHITTAEFLRQVRTQTAFRCTCHEIVAAYCDIFTENEPIVTLLERLKGRFRLVLASNTTPLHASYLRSKYPGLWDYFGARALSFELGARKPSREYFAGCRRMAQCEPAECLLIDDLAANVEAALREGWDAIRYVSCEELHQALAERGIL